MSTPGRIAFREEGNWWVCYLAPAHTMQGAAELGRITMTLARIPQVRRRWLDTMTEAVIEGLAGSLGFRLKWNAPEPAPEHEKAGKA